MRKIAILLSLSLSLAIGMTQQHKHPQGPRAINEGVPGECEFRTINVFNKDTMVLRYVLIDLISPAKDIENTILNMQLPSGSYEVRLTTIVGLKQRWFSAVVTPISVKIHP